ncbi:hypothetical protein ACS0TY_027069 [Phlomoides rotata]
MEKEGNYLGNFPTLDYNNNHDDPEIGASSSDHNNNNSSVVDYMLNNPQLQQQQSANFYGSNSFDKLSFADVMQFADFGPKLGLNQSKSAEEESSYMLKFPVLASQSLGDDFQETGEEEEEENSLRLQPVGEGKSKRKRARSVKTVEEVESQRMTHIAVERNRRKQMNEHLRVLRSLMPSSYVQRGDQASIIGGAIEFVRELEQLLQCLESQKRRRLYGDGPAAAAQPPNVEQLIELQQGLHEEEESAESKSCLADVEVKVVGFDALIKILSRRRPEQLIKTIAALQDLHLTILHTNITTIEQTVLYSFNVKIGGEAARFTAEDLANSIQQIFSFIHANTTI